MRVVNILCGTVQSGRNTIVLLVDGLLATREMTDDSTRVSGGMEVLRLVKISLSQIRYFYRAGMGHSQRQGPVTPVFLVRPRIVNHSSPAIR